MLSYSAWEEGVRGTCPTLAGAQSHREEGQRIGKRDFTLGLQAGGWGGGAAVAEARQLRSSARSLTLG